MGVKIRATGNDQEPMQFFCPGCCDWHFVHTKTKNGSGAQWKFNDNYEKPTFSPSIHLKTGKYVDPNWQEPNLPGNWSVICHSFIVDGLIKFCNDSTHSLKGKTVPLPDI